MLLLYIYRDYQQAVARGWLPSKYDDHTLQTIATSCNDAFIPVAPLKSPSHTEPLKLLGASHTAPYSDRVGKGSKSGYPAGIEYTLNNPMSRKHLTKDPRTKIVNNSDVGLQGIVITCLLFTVLVAYLLRARWSRDTRSKAAHVYAPLPVDDTPLKTVESPANGAYQAI